MILFFCLTNAYVYFCVTSLLLFAFASYLFFTVFFFLVSCIYHMAVLAINCIHPVHYQCLLIFFKAAKSTGPFSHFIILHLGFLQCFILLFFQLCPSAFQNIVPIFFSFSPSSKHVFTIKIWFTLRVWKYSCFDYPHFRSFIWWSFIYSLICLGLCVISFSYLCWSFSTLSCKSAYMCFFLFWTIVLPFSDHIHL